MENLNSVILHGNLTADPEVRAIKTGGNLTTFSIATNHGWKNKEGKRVSQTDFHRVVAFGKLGEVVATYLKKGQPIIVQGRLSNSSYVGKDGHRRYVTEVVLEDFNFLPSSRRGAEKVTASPETVQAEEEAVVAA